MRRIRSVVIFISTSVETLDDFKSESMLQSISHGHKVPKAKSTLFILCQVELHQRVYLVFSFGTVLLDLISGEHIPPSHTPFGGDACLRVNLTAIQEILLKSGSYSHTGNT
ncbi:hypothetical protein AXX17_AT4G13330 [Arabidopsis thaliana]|uniref:Uncharacterized protein n=1 Tax=Arabidopsis thaliana TaxID=3702 RepID=A0A178UW42_ARATH|nr:hypothetical protein AXX17_AT4G13330 [Arabidopsis thaliana]